jgi:hypothetical protein
MATATASKRFLTTGEAARRLGAAEWQVARLFVRNLLPEPARFGRYRLIDESDLPQLREALVEAGYLQVAQDAGEPPPAKRGPE